MMMMMMVMMIISAGIFHKSYLSLRIHILISLIQTRIKINCLKYFDNRFATDIITWTWTFLERQYNTHVNTLKWRTVSYFVCEEAIFVDLYLCYDMMYLLTAVGLTPGGSSTEHIYIQTIHRTTKWNTILRTEHTLQ